MAWTSEVMVSSRVRRINRSSDTASRSCMPLFASSARTRERLRLGICYHNTQMRCHSIFLDLICACLLKLLSTCTCCADCCHLASLCFLCTHKGPLQSWRTTPSTLRFLDKIHTIPHITRSSCHSPLLPDLLFSTEPLLATACSISNSQVRVSCKGRGGIRTERFHIAVHVQDLLLQLGALPLRGVPLLHQHLAARPQRLRIRLPVKTQIFIT